MADLLIILRDAELPARLYGSCAGISIRGLARSEQLSIEDYCHKKLSKEIALRGPYATVALLDVVRHVELANDCEMVVQFALSMIAHSGHPQPLFSAVFENGGCIGLNVVSRVKDYLTIPDYLPVLRRAAVCQWIATCLVAFRKSRDRLHITMYRFVRYALASNRTDALMDLAISLESLLESQTEVAFKFSALLTKSAGKRGDVAIYSAELLADLYSLRSKLAHGDPGAGKLMKKMKPRAKELHKLCREILTNYVIYLSAHSKEEWVKHLRERLYA